MDEAPKLQVKEVATVRKFDGEWVEGATPVETITVETVSDYATGEIISQTVTKE